MIKGIDISAHNGAVDFEAVKASGISFAIIRAGWSWYDGGMNIDVNFLDNMKNAIALGLEVGVYLYAYDLTAEAAQKAADLLADLLQKGGYKLSYPIYYDQEDNKLLSLTRQQRTDIAKAFLERMQQRGYYAAVYSYTSWLNNQLDMKQLAAFDVWVAQYAEKCSYKGDYGMWQYTVIGTLGTQGKDYYTRGSQPGVRGNCDLNICYKDYPAIIRKAGLNGFGNTVEPPEPSCSVTVGELRSMGYTAIML